MKKTSILKLVLAVGAFVLLSPMGSDAADQGVKDTVECHQCNMHWNKPWGKCFDKCFGDSSEYSVQQNCEKSCNDKVSSGFQACVKKMVSKKNQARCKFRGDVEAVIGPQI